MAFNIDKTIKNIKNISKTVAAVILKGTAAYVVFVNIEHDILMYSNNVIIEAFPSGTNTPFDVITLSDSKCIILLY